MMQAWSPFCSPLKVEKRRRLERLCTGDTPIEGKTFDSEIELFLRGVLSGLQEITKRRWHSFGRAILPLNT